VKVLLDTCVLSELYRTNAAPQVRQFIADFPDDALYLSVITLGELGNGIALLPDGRKKHDLSVWVRRIMTTYAARVLAVDAEVAEIWGEITANAQKQGIVIPAADGLIAATALRHGLHLVTRNVRDFQATGVLLLNPWG
jgi:predicted nucleic acid-binding protein